jgi:EAL domain-containing protein (putative c-di-GMP-specific phosphodiesterase class I)
VCRVTPQPPADHQAGDPGGSELSWDELISGGPGSTPAAHDRHARRPRVRPPSVLDLRAQTPVGGVTPEVTAERVLDLGRPPAPAQAPPTPPPTPVVRQATRQATAPPPAQAAPQAPPQPAPQPAPPQHTPTDDDVDDERELEERVAHVLRSPETLRGVHQPIVDLRTGDCVGYEAFVRIADWPARSPRPWFDAAARVGLAVQLEAAALATSLRARLTMPGDRLLAVNLSTASLTDDHVLRVLDDEDDLSRLLLTPSPAREALPPAGAAEALTALRGRGMLLGVKLREGGRSDLDVVDGLRPDVVVLTREFAADMHASGSRQRLLGTLTRIAGETGAAVLATGVESVADARCLQRCGVHLGQGWLFGRPRPGFLPPPAGTAEWLRDAAGPADGTQAGEPGDEGSSRDGGREASDDEVARRAAEANAMTTPPGIPVPRQRAADGGSPGPGRHTAEHPVVP